MLIQKKITVTENGVKKRVSIYGHTEAEVRRKAAAYKTEVARGPVFDDVLYAWQEAHFPDLAYGSQQMYKAASNHLLDFFSGERLAEIRPLEIKRMFEVLKKQGYSSRTVKAVKTMLGMVYSFAVIDLDLDVTVPSVPVPRGLPVSKRDLPSDEDIEKIKNSGDPFMLFLLYTGCRRGEALAVKWSDIDFDSRMVSISKILTFENNRGVIHERTKTAAGRRSIFLLPPLEAVLEPLRGSPDSFVFMPHPFKESEFRAFWRRSCESVGVSVTPHQLRHAYATILFDAGVDEKVTQELMGHSDISLTRDVYTHIRESRMEAERARIEKTLNVLTLPQSS